MTGAKNAPVGMPLRQLILKIHSRCNLSCDYCYVYESIDQSWRGRPTTMAPATIEQIARRIDDHAHRHDLRDLQVVLHGGEPLLAGHDGVAAALSAIRGAFPATRFSMQTNGILLDERFLALLHEYGVRVGVSVDGGQAATDRHRRYANGRGSYDRIAAGIELLMRPEHAEIYGGLLCTIDIDNDPDEVLEGLLGFRPPRVDLLLPHGNWTNPPPHHDRPLAYARWLIRVFDRWYDQRPEPTRIRMFESIIARLFGLPSQTEAFGGEQLGIVTVETDGAYEQSDALKTTAEGGPATGLSVTGHSFDDVLEHLAVAAPYRLSQQCRSCPVVSVCGGGLRAHRYAEETGFDNPSVYCQDLLALITHIGDRVRADLNNAAVLAQ
ncbi:FxsB family cyclophane-forming radical SAM/SPASM peptide maturase [Dactylosporangium sp. NPDC000244]|uniref:FxsB family cyclophane-forming radical SAM/SPASM peptide maturase n=1 Tax=Dactylosporangium sp. NPDC000244 TaxID=3154365 RepID=UPI0033225526